MKNSIITTLLLFLVTQVFSQDVLGYWKSVDDESGKTRSIVHVYQESDGTVSGKIIKLFPGPGEELDPVCQECESDDPRYMKKIIGMVIMKNMKKDGNVFAGGLILDPENGSDYRCKIWTDGKDVLKVRGYLGPFYRTQSWKREPNYQG